jgi:hypothetical protein
LALESCKDLHLFYDIFQSTVFSVTSISSFSAVMNHSPHLPAISVLVFPHYSTFWRKKFP